eukprot:3521700-Amphidinium_carterae.1
MDAGKWGRYCMATEVAHNTQPTELFACVGHSSLHHGFLSRRTVHIGDGKSPAFPQHDKGEFVGCTDLKPVLMSHIQPLSGLLVSCFAKCALHNSGFWFRMGLSLACEDRVQRLLVEHFVSTCSRLSHPRALRTLSASFGGMLLCQGCVIFCAASLTDWLDGFLARKWKVPAHEVNPCRAVFELSLCNMR